MSKVLIIGAGGVGRVVAFKCAKHPEVFSEILLASRTLSKCDDIAKDINQEIGYQSIRTAKVDAVFTRAKFSILNGCRIIAHQREIRAGSMNAIARPSSGSIQR